MPAEFQIISAREFIRFGAHGHLDWDESCAALTQLARSCLDRGIDRALLDVRDVRSDLTQEQLMALVQTFHDVGFKDHHRLAVLHGEDREARARLFAYFAAHRGWDVQAFDNFEDAIGWLAIAEEADWDVEGVAQPGEAAKSKPKSEQPPE